MKKSLVTDKTFKRLIDCLRRTKDSSLHPDSHRDFALNDKYVILNGCVVEGQLASLFENEAN